MRMSIIPKYSKVTVDDVSIECDYTVAGNIEFAFFDNVLAYGKITYNDGTENKIITAMPNVESILNAYWAAYGTQLLPSTYHSWDSETHEFYITAENQALKDQVEADAQAAQDITDAELASNPLVNITFEQAETWIDNTVIDLATAKIAFKEIFRLILART
jgi:hypothetical protein